MWFWSKKSSARNNDAAKKRAPQPCVGKHDSANALDNTARLLKDISNLSTHCVCRLEINPNQYSTAIDAFIRICGIESSCDPIIQEFECFQTEKIEQSVAQTFAGKNVVAQTSAEIKAREEEVNRILPVKLLNQKRPNSYPFSHLREFLKPAGNGDMWIEYPAVVLDADRQNHRQAVLRGLKQICVERFSNCKVLSSNTTSVTIEFN